MKRLLKIITLTTLATLATLAYQLPGPRPVLFTWLYDADSSNPESNVVFNIYMTTNVGLPDTAWPLFIQGIPGTNRSYATNLMPANYFALMTTSNEVWHVESVFSNSTNGPLLNVVRGRGTQIKPL